MDNERNEEKNPRDADSPAVFTRVLATGGLRVTTGIRAGTGVPEADATEEEDIRSSN